MPAGSLISSSGRGSAAPKSSRRPGIWWLRPPERKDSVQINSDFRDLLQLFAGEAVRFLVVGGYAVMLHTEPSYTKDLDIWIEPSLDNAERALRALIRFGTPAAGVSAADLANPD